MKIRIFAKPNAKNSTLIEIDEQGIHIALHAKPKQGEANKELINFLSTLINLPKSQITLQKGAGSRYKHVKVPLSESVQSFINNMTTTDSTVIQ